MGAVTVLRGFSQCRFHAEKWGICHHLEVDSDNGTATTEREGAAGDGDFPQNGKIEDGRAAGGVSQEERERGNDGRMVV